MATYIYIYIYIRRIDMQGKPTTCVCCLALPVLPWHAIYLKHVDMHANVYVSPRHACDGFALLRCCCPQMSCLHAVV
jgi:hypothetical protein